MQTTQYSAGHVGLNVTDLSRSKQFYSDVFGFETLGESSEGERKFAFLGYGENVLLTLWQQSEGGFEADCPGLHHLAFFVPSVEEIRDAEKALKGLGVRFRYDGIVRHAEGVNSGGIYFEDPDGIRLEIVTREVPESAEAPHGAAPSCGLF